MSQVSIVRTHNAYHLGDNLVHLNFLRRVALANPDRQFVHYAQWQHLIQLRDMIQDVPNITLAEFGHNLPADSINAWRGARKFWYEHPDRLDFVKFHVEAWFPLLADRMGVDNPVKAPDDMLFDYPGFLIWKPGIKVKESDILVINSAPGSGQWQGYDEFLLGNLVMDLDKKGHRVVTTAPIPQPDTRIPCTANYQMTVTEIGCLSLHCHTILMISTGPSWPTFNIWNRETIKRRIILLTSERIHLSPNTVHCSTVTEAAEELKKAGLL